MNNLNALLPVADLEVGEELKKTVNARQLHRWLGVGKDFSTWINNRIQQYGFEQDKDFVVVEELSSPNLANSKCGSGEFSPNLGKTPKGGRPCIPSNLHLYGTVDDDGKPFTGLRRGSVTKALHRLKDAAAFNLHVSQLESQLACNEATA